MAWWLFIALSFIYIKGVYCIYYNIYNISPSNVYFSFKANVCIDIHIIIWMDNVYFTIRMYVFGLPDRLLRGFFMASIWLLCVSFVCVTFIT